MLYWNQFGNPLPIIFFAYSFFNFLKIYCMLSKYFYTNHLFSRRGEPAAHTNHPTGYSYSYNNFFLDPLTQKILNTYVFIYSYVWLCLLTAKEYRKKFSLKMGRQLMLEYSEIRSPMGILAQLHDKPVWNLQQQINSKSNWIKGFNLNPAAAPVAIA